MKKVFLTLACTSACVSICTFAANGKPTDPVDTGNIRADTTEVLIVTKDGRTDTTIIVKKTFGLALKDDIDELCKEMTTVKNMDSCRKRSIYLDGILDLGINVYRPRNIITGVDGGDDFLPQRTARSINLGMYPFVANLRINKSRTLEFKFGPGLEWSNFHFEDGWTLEKVDGVTVPSDRYRTDGSDPIRRSKLTTLYLNVPLILQWNFPGSNSPGNRFYVAAGVIGGLHLRSHTKVVGANWKRKDFESLNLSTLTYDFSVRAGYKGIGIYFNYQMTPMFRDGKGPKLFPYAVGISF